MTDNEIIKALECCCIAWSCEECPCRGNNGACTGGVADFEVLDIINRQRAEIKDLKSKRRFAVEINITDEQLEQAVDRYFKSDDFENVRSAARSLIVSTIKVFAERVKNSKKNIRDVILLPHGKKLFDAIINNIAENMIREVKKEDTK